MSQATITCPPCKSEITLTEALAAPLIPMWQHADFCRKRPRLLDAKSRSAAKRAELANAVEINRAAVHYRSWRQNKRALRQRRPRKHEYSWAMGLESKSKEVASTLYHELQERDHKLAEAQKAQTKSVRKQQELVVAKAKRVRETPTKSTSQSRKRKMR